MRTAASSLWQIVAKAPVSRAGHAILGWFYYLFSSLLLWFAAMIAAPVVWGLFYFFAHHTGLELLTNLLKIRIACCGLQWRFISPSRQGTFEPPWTHFHLFWLQCWPASCGNAL